MKNYFPCNIRYIGNFSAALKYDWNMKLENFCQLNESLSRVAKHSTQQQFPWLKLLIHNLTRQRKQRRLKNSDRPGTSSCECKSTVSCLDPYLNPIHAFWIIYVKNGCLIYCRSTISFWRTQKKRSNGFIHENLLATCSAQAESLMEMTVMNGFIVNCRLADLRCEMHATMLIASSLAW